MGRLLQQGLAAPHTVYQHDQVNSTVQSMHGLQAACRMCLRCTLRDIPQRIPQRMYCGTARGGGGPS